MKKINYKEIIEWTLCILVAIILALCVRTFLGTPTVVQQVSMYPTLIENERLVLNRLSVKVGAELKRGDIITFEAPTKALVPITEIDFDNPVAQYDYKPEGLIQNFKYYVLEVGKMSYIKRVIATEGEHVKIEEGKVYVNGKLLEENYLQPDVITTSMNGYFTDLVVPKGSIFVMGDNRGESTDSRRFGCVPIEKVESKVLIRFWPLTKFGGVE